MLVQHAEQLEDDHEARRRRHHDHDQPRAAHTSILPAPRRFRFLSPPLAFARELRQHGAMRAPAFIAVAALAAALLIACGGSDAAPAAPSQPDATVAAAATTAATAATEAPATARATAAATETPAAAVAALPRVYFIHTEW